MSLALLSNDPNIFLKSVVDEEQHSGENGGSGGEAGLGETDTSNLAAGDTEQVQLKLRDSFETTKETPLTQLIVWLMKTEVQLG
ncbi:hypothetical protein RSAG8_10761, partial [Rhizoctonia solani AG-8 WAC10335]